MLGPEDDRIMLPGGFHIGVVPGSNPKSYCLVHPDGKAPVMMTYEQALTLGKVMNTERWSEPQGDVARLRQVLTRLVEWNRKYPSQRIYNEGTIRSIAKQMDEINEEAILVLATVPVTA